METLNRKVFEQAGIDGDFMQYNYNSSVAGTVGGLHYQIEQAQGKLVRVVNGAVFDAVVDIRKSSPDFGQWAKCRYFP